MIRLDKAKPHGKVTPPLDVDGCPQAAHYEQDGILFDAHGMPCVPGAAQVIAPKAEAESMLSFEALIADVDTMPYQKLLKNAKAILGDTCPTGKKPIIEALLAAKEAYDARKAKRGEVQVEAVLLPTEPVSAPAQAPAPVAPVAAAKTSNGVDLAAWGRGQKDYLFGEIRKAVREVYHAQLSERRDVVDLLIEQRVITAQEARKDL